MSLAQGHLDRLLKLDVKSYLKAPSRFARAEVPYLENWRVALACEAAGCPSSILLAAAMVITGRAQRSGRAPVTTPPLVWLIATGRGTDSIGSVIRPCPHEPATS
ncbi:hypothetical protein Nham_1978 [Nitrobacter hamburgensis X14]|uniref:Uncharacterized protein n=1 Tax=Nitrobacter hamburgensis (strain DSM 10229 / NCIMB 13809 / X14) TaxID=323097 RepID=Q1QLW9_NITHX|nr:hypothetical protein [Nitrobacter hamburgensis]ABE62778.1 hypothetical protein Nham_1978 [Nitrobacter hamburgensis X14]